MRGQQPPVGCQESRPSLGNLGSGGLRAGSGFTVGLLGGLIGLHWSLGLSAAALTFATGLVFLYSLVDSAPRVPSRT